MKIILRERENSLELFMNETDSITYLVRDVRQTKQMILQIISNHLMSDKGTDVLVNYVNGETEEVHLV